MKKLLRLWVTVIFYAFCALRQIEISAISPDLSDD